MNNYQVRNMVFVKGNNSTQKINLSYGRALFIYIFLVIIAYLSFGYNDLIIPLLKSLGISLLIASIFSYIINLFRKRYNFLDIYLKDYTHIIALTIGLFTVNKSIIVISIAVIISLLFKLLYKPSNISASLIGILFVLLYSFYYDKISSPLIEIITSNVDTVIKNYDGIKGLLVGSYYLNPIISLIMFIYLFHKKSLKYPIVLSYLITFMVIIFFYGLIHGEHIWYLFFHIASGNILFMSTILLSNHMMSPTIKESGIIYGIILGITSAILRFIVPELAIVIPLIIGPFILTKFLDNLSPKLKYNRKIYYVVLCSLILVVILATIGLIFIYK